MAFFAYLLPFLAFVAKAEVDLSMYQRPNFQGDYLTMNLYNTCVDLLADFNDLTNSIDTGGGCAMVCKDTGCKGGCIKMEPGSIGLDDLSKVGYGNSISSVKDCNPPPKSTLVSLYWDSNYKGAKYDYNLVGDECVNVETGFNDKASSVDTHRGCALLYKDGNCKGQVIEMKPGVAGWDFLGNVGFNDALSSLKNC